MAAEMAWGGGKPSNVKPRNVKTFFRGFKLRFQLVITRDLDYSRNNNVLVTVNLEYNIREAQKVKSCKVLFKKIKKKGTPPHPTKA